MELVSIDSQTTPSSVLISHNYETMLKESIERFISEIQRGISDFSGFTSIFFRLLQARVDPPLETIWFCSAVRFRSYQVEEEEGNLLSRVSRVKDLFQLLTSCSASCNGLKSVAVVCPVLFELHQVVVDLFGRKMLTKTEKKAMKEVECLVEGVLSYISLCGCYDFGKDDVLGELLPCFGELLSVWTIDQSKGSCGIAENLKLFFPLVSVEIRDGFARGEFGVGYLVGVVIVQAFLLRLCLKLQAGGGLSKSALLKDLTTWAVGSITAYRNCCFFEVLLRLLLESTLPVTSLLDTKNEALLRKVLYDAVILVDYSFLDIEREVMLTSNCMNRIALRRLIVVHEATTDAREKGDHTKAISYMNAFSRLCLPSKFVKWVANQIGMHEETIKPNANTPEALLKWLLNLENQGVKVFDNNPLKLRAKLLLDETKGGYEHRVLQPDSKVGDDLLFFIDNKREGEEEKVDDEEMVESIDASFKAAAQAMRNTDNGVRRKRKEEKTSEKKTKVKFLKYNIHESGAKEKHLHSKAPDSATSSDSEENGVVGEDMEE